MISYKKKYLKYKLKYQKLNTKQYAGNIYDINDEKYNLVYPINLKIGNKDFTINNKYIFEKTELSSLSHYKNKTNTYQVSLPENYLEDTNLNILQKFFDMNDDEFTIFPISTFFTSDYLEKIKINNFKPLYSLRTLKTNPMISNNIQIEPTVDQDTLSETLILLNVNQSNISNFNNNIQVENILHTIKKYNNKHIELNKYFDENKADIDTIKKLKSIELCRFILTCEYLNLPNNITNYFISLFIKNEYILKTKFDLHSNDELIEYILDVYRFIFIKSTEETYRGLELYEYFKNYLTNSNFNYGNTIMYYDKHIINHYNDLINLSKNIISLNNYYNNVQISSRNKFTNNYIIANFINITAEYIFRYYSENLKFISDNNLIFENLNDLEKIIEISKLLKKQNNLVKQFYKLQQREKDLVYKILLNMYESNNVTTIKSQQYNSSFKKVPYEYRINYNQDFYIAIKILQDNSLKRSNAMEHITRELKWFKGKEHKFAQELFHSILL